MKVEVKVRVRVMMTMRLGVRAGAMVGESVRVVVRSGYLLIAYGRSRADDEENQGERERDVE